MEYLGSSSRSFGSLIVTNCKKIYVLGGCLNG